MEIHSTNLNNIPKTLSAEEILNNPTVKPSAENYQRMAALLPLNVGNRPLLTTPLNFEQLSNFSKQVQGDSELISKVADNKLKELSEMSKSIDSTKTLDISNLSSSAVALMVNATVLLSAMRIAETKLSSQLSVISFEATKSAAQNIVNQGTAVLSSSITGAVMQVGITGIGAKKSHSGISEQKGAIKNNLTTVQNLEKELTGSKLSLNKQIDISINQSNKTGSKLIGDNKLTPDNPILSSEHKESLSFADKTLQEKINIQRNSYDINTLSGQQKQNLGRATMESSSLAGNVSQAGGRYASAIEEEEQMINQASSKQAEDASQVSKETSRATSELINKLMQVIDSINQSRNSAASQIAGNIRA
ncbi:IpaC/SipC family type III secretion system effector [Escherichia coli]|uniref:IpaC/SipC family type III secretion system effector n=1 Tax=Escherichia coli TaxID=562 RepID=UPI0039C43045